MRLIFVLGPAAIILLLLVLLLLSMSMSRPAFLGIHLFGLHVLVLFRVHCEILLRLREDALFECETGNIIAVRQKGQKCFLSLGK
jgi:hypothetical protein